MKKTAWIVAIVISVAVAGWAQESGAAKAKPSAARGTMHPPQTHEMQPAPTAEVQPRAPPTESATLPTGTTVRMKLETMLSTAVTKRNDEFAGRVTEPIMLDGRTIIPVGASVIGQLVRKER